MNKMCLNSEDTPRRTPSPLTSDTLLPSGARTPGVTVPPLCFLGAECRWEMLNRNAGRPSGAGSGRRRAPKRQQCQKGNNAKKTTMPKRQKAEKLPEPPGRPAQGGERGRRWERRRAEGSAEALAVRVAQRGHVVSELCCSQLLSLTLRRARRKQYARPKLK